MNAVVQAIERLTEMTKEGRLVWSIDDAFGLAAMPARTRLCVDRDGEALQLTLTDDDRAVAVQYIALRYGGTVLVDTHSRAGASEATAVQELNDACWVQVAKQSERDRTAMAERLMSMIGGDA